TTLAVQQNLHAGFAGKLDHAILGVDARSAEGLILVPEQPLVVVDELGSGGKYIEGCHSALVDDRPHVVALVDALIVESRVKYLESVTHLRDVVFLKEAVGDSDNR